MSQEMKYKNIRRKLGKYHRFSEFHIERAIRELEKHFYERKTRGYKTN